MAEVDGVVPFSLFVVLCWEVVRDRVTSSSLRICGPYAEEKVNLPDMVSSTLSFGVSSRFSVTSPWLMRIKRACLTAEHDSEGGI